MSAAFYLQGAYDMAELVGWSVLAAGLTFPREQGRALGEVYRLAHELPDSAPLSRAARKCISAGLALGREQRR